MNQFFEQRRRLLMAMSGGLPYTYYTLGGSNKDIVKYNNIEYENWRMFYLIGGSIHGKEQALSPDFNGTTNASQIALPYQGDSIAFNLKNWKQVDITITTTVNWGTYTLHFWYKRPDTASPGNNHYEAIQKQIRTNETVSVTFKREEMQKNTYDSGDDNFATCPIGIYFGMPQVTINSIKIS